MVVSNDNGTRPVTRAHRSFGAEQLRQLKREDVRKLCHGLLLADCAVVDDYRSNAEIDEFAVTVPGLWHMQRVLVRIYHRPIRQDDVDDARTFARRPAHSSRLYCQCRVTRPMCLSCRA